MPRTGLDWLIQVDGMQSARLKSTCQRDQAEQGS